VHLAPFTDPDKPGSYSRDPALTWQHILDSGEHVGYDDELGLWLIAGHDNVRAALSDPRRLCNAATLAPVTPPTEQATRVLAGFDAPDVAVSADPPVHARTRAVLRSVFPNTAERAADKWGALVQRRVTQLADHLTDRAGTGPVDLVQQFSTQLPLLVVLDILGVPADEASQVLAGSDGFVTLIWGDLAPDVQVRAAQGFVRFWRYCRAYVASRAAGTNDSDDLIAELLRYRDNDDGRLTEAEIAGFVINLIVAGWATTSAAIAHALEHALTDPHRWTRIGVDAHYAAIHTEETLRHSPPLDGWLRLTTTDVTVDGVTIPAGSRCLVLLGTANHDPRIFADPATFDPGRARLSHHLAFGAGPHYCIGAALARLEIATALQSLAQRLPDLRLAPDYQRRFHPNVAARSHVAMPAGIGSDHCPVAHGES
jgi:hypothetical protein